MNCNSKINVLLIFQSEEKGVTCQLSVGQTFAFGPFCFPPFVRLYTYTPIFLNDSKLKRPHFLTIKKWKTQKVTFFKLLRFLLSSKTPNWVVSQICETRSIYFYFRLSNYDVSWNERHHPGKFARIN